MPILICTVGKILTDVNKVESGYFPRFAMWHFLVGLRGWGLRSCSTWLISVNQDVSDQDKGQQWEPSPGTFEKQGQQRKEQQGKFDVRMGKEHLSVPGPSVACAFLPGCQSDACKVIGSALVAMRDGVDTISLAFMWISKMCLFKVLEMLFFWEMLSWDSGQGVCLCTWAGKSRWQTITRRSN